MADDTTTPPTAPTSPATPAASTSPDLGGILKDSRFQSLPATERHRFLTRNYPQYASLPPEEQHKFFMRNALAHTDVADTIGKQIWGAVSGPVKTLGTAARAIGDPMSPDEGDKSAARADLTQTGKNLITQPVHELWEGKQPTESVMTPPSHPVMRPFNMLTSLMGGDPAEMRRATERGDSGSAVAAAVTVPILTAGLGKLFHTMIGEEANAPTRQQVSSLQSMSGQKGITGAGPIDAATRTARISQLYKQALMESGVTDDTLKSAMSTREHSPNSDIVGDVGRGNDLVLKTTRAAVDIAQRPLDAVLQTQGTRPAGRVGQDIAASLRAQAMDVGKVDPRIGSALGGLADKIVAAKTFNDLNEIKIHANKLINDVYSAIPGKAIAASAETAYAYKLAADAIRDKMYPALEQYAGGKVDLSAMGQREADAIKMRDGIHQTYYSQVAPQSASRAASDFLGYIIAGEGAPGHSLYSRHILARAAEKTHLIPGPGGEFNKQFARAGKQGEGMQPERVRLTPPPSAPHSTMPVQGASTVDLMVDRLRQGQHTPTAEYTDQGFRSAFNIPQKITFRELVAAGLAEKTERGYKLGPRVMQKLNVEVEPYQAGRRNVPLRKTKAAGGAGAVASGSRLKPPPKADEDEQAEPPDDQQ